MHVRFFFSSSSLLLWRVVWLKVSQAPVRLLFFFYLVRQQTRCFADKLYVNAKPAVSITALLLLSTTHSSCFTISKPFCRSFLSYEQFSLSYFLFMTLSFFLSRSLLFYSLFPFMFVVVVCITLASTSTYTHIHTNSGITFFFSYRSFEKKKKKRRKKKEKAEKQTE